MSPEQEVLSILLQHKLDMLDTTANTSMLWWVSSVVFCGYALSASWYYRDEFVKVPRMKLLFLFMTFFFISIVAYGCYICYGIWALYNETSYLVTKLGVRENLLFEFKGTLSAVAIGTTSFVVVLILWILFWNHMRKEQNKLS